MPLAKEPLALLAAALRNPQVVLRYQAKMVTAPGSDCLWWRDAVSGPVITAQASEVSVGTLDLVGLRPGGADPPSERFGPDPKQVQSPPPKVAYADHNPLHPPTNCPVRAQAHKPGSTCALHVRVS